MEVLAWEEESGEWRTYDEFYKIVIRSCALDLSSLYHLVRLFKHFTLNDTNSMAGNARRIDEYASLNAQKLTGARTYRVLDVPLFSIASDQLVKLESLILSFFRVHLVILR